MAISSLHLLQSPSVLPKCLPVWVVTGLSVSSSQNLSPSGFVIWAPQVSLPAPIRLPSCREISLALRLCMHAQSFQAWVTLWDPMDCSPSGSSVHGILQARILEWVAMTSFRGSSLPRDWTSVSYVYLHWQVVSLPLAPSANGKNHCSQWIQ